MPFFVCGEGMFLLALEHVILRSASSCQPPNIPAGFDFFLDPDLHVQRLPVEELAELRRVAPIWWCEQAIGKGGFNDGGYWVVTKHKDVKEVSRRNDVFLSSPNTAIPQFPPDEMAREDIDLQKVVMLNMDGEYHDRLRRIISKGVHAARHRRSA